MNLARLTDDLIISEWLLHEPEAEGRLDLPMDLGDWAAANEIRAEIYLPPDADVRLFIDEIRVHHDPMRGISPEPAPFRDLGSHECCVRRHSIDSSPVALAAVGPDAGRPPD